MLVNSNTAETVFVTITDIRGVEAKKLQMHTNKEVQINLDEPNGLYYVSIKGQLIDWSGKVTILR